MIFPLSLLLQTSSIWSYIVPFIGALLSLGVGYLLARLNRSYSETKEQKQAREKSEREQEDWKKKVDATLEKYHDRMLGFQQQHERFAEGCARDQEAIKAEVQEAKRALQEVALLRNQVENTNKALEEVKMELRDLNKNFLEFFRTR
ncbi:hypothetical protein LJ737_20675 [Hymenobacter sp. 15J16-1T3B]|uniref:hypothetical protein n=1 Tax=Hymenobacter sp. 15J16-1T3B TaxID=2886941 RepID=UPI001D0F8F59|nr:hypothetical protein [Hymenobacter sp. 15J16-1T3B]MCC3159668.1 hypothetical protein [Hymenobacter sp. 15J16-1T3B]